MQFADVANSMMAELVRHLKTQFEMESRLEVFLVSLVTMNKDILLSTTVSSLKQEQFGRYLVNILP